MAAKVLEKKTKEDHQTENVNLLDEIKSLGLNDIAEDYQNIPLWLRNFESPFHWHNQLPRSFCSELTIQRCLERLDEISWDEEEFSLYRYSVLLNLALCYSSVKNKEKVKETIKTIKSDIEKNSVQQDPQYERFKIILAHVVSTTEAYVLALDKKEEQSKKVAQIILPIDQMSTSNKAGLCAIKGNFFGNCRYDGAENVAVALFREAGALEPENHEWLYLLSIVLRQQRKDVPFNIEVPHEELELLEKAVQQCKSPKYLLYLAQVYRECATQAHKQHLKKPNYYTSNVRKTIQDMQNKALCYYKEALQLNPNHAGNLRRIGYGIMNLPKYLADYDLALECLLKSLELCKSSFTLHVLGTFYHRYGKDNKKALQYFIKSDSFPGLCDAIRVKYMENPDYDPCEDIEKGLQREIKTKNRVFLLSQRGGYFLFIKRNFLKSIDSFNQAISEDKDSIHLTVFKSFFLRMFDTINLYHYMANESLLYLPQSKSSLKEEGKDDNMNKVMAFFDTITKIYPELGNIDPDPYLIDKLLSKQHMTEENPKISKSRFHQDKPKCNLQSGRQSGFQPGGERGLSGRGGSSENRNNWTRRPYSENQRNNEQTCANVEEERPGRLAGNFRERGQYPNRGKQSGLHSDKSPIWQKKL